MKKSVLTVFVAMFFGVGVFTSCGGDYTQEKLDKDLAKIEKEYEAKMKKIDDADTVKQVELFTKTLVQAEKLRAKRAKAVIKEKEKKKKLKESGKAK
jgi:hypothetical protein